MYKPNSQQKKAIEYIKGPLIIVAGAGTGKTTVITHKIAYLLENKLAQPEEILALTFNDKASNEIQERVDELINIGYIEMQISTFHTFCQRILEEYGLDIGLPNSFKLLTQTDTWMLVRKNLDKFNLDYYRPLGSPTKHIHELINHFSKCKDELVSPKEYLEYSKNTKFNNDIILNETQRLIEIANAYQVYNQLLLDNDSLDFGDLIYYTVKLLEKRLHILTKLQKRFKFILVDEFQDVNWAQYQLIRFLADKKSSVSVVGDDDQSIYAFRGASVSNIMHFKDDYPKAQEIVLNQNYRSGQKILDLAYNSIKHNSPDRLEDKLNINKELKSQTKYPGEVIHIHKNTLDEEIQSVIQEIIKLKKIDKNTVWDDFAILVRANNHATPFINYLENNRIPYEFLASAGLYRQPIVLDCLNFFRIIDSHYESVAIYRLLKIPCFKIKEADLQKFVYNCKRKSVSYYEGLKRAKKFYLSENGIKICDKLISLIHNGMKQARYEKPSQVLYSFLLESEYLKYLTTQEEKNNRTVIRQIYQLNQFFNVITKYEENISDAKVADWLEQFEYLIDSGEQGALYQPTDTPDSINIITVHRAKGLEFKYVFIVNLVQDRFPTRKRGEGIELPNKLIKEQLPEGDSHTQEERRLFYVACTRAKEKLYLISASDYGGSRKKKVSKFLDEIGFKANINDTTLANQDKKTRQVNRVSSETEKSEFIYQLPNSFSFSQIKSYNTCPYQYKLGNIIKLPTKQSHYFSFGNTIHNTLHEFYNQVQILNSAKQETLFSNNINTKLVSNNSSRKKDKKMSVIKLKVPNLEELLKIYEQKWIGDWYQSKKQRKKYFDQGLKMLKVFYENNENNWTIPVALESGFKIKIGESYLTGRFDRIDILKDGTIEIIDYKTSKGKEKPQRDEKEQLILYQIAVSKLPQYTNLGQVSKLTLYFVKDNLKASFLANEKDIIKLENKIITTVEKIKNHQFKANPNQHICKYCQFKDICEHKC